jgi:hypothetical protein
MSDFEGLNISMEEEERSSFIPEGDYPVIINVCERTTSQSGNDYLKMEAEVTGDNYAGWRLRKNFNLWYQNDDKTKQEEIRGYANNDFSRLARAVGFREVPKTAWEFQGKTFVARVVVQGDEDDEYGPSNEIKSFLPVQTESAPKAVDLPPSIDESNDTSPGEAATPSKPSL